MKMMLGLSTELDVVTGYSEIVPDTVVFDDFERLRLVLSINGFPIEFVNQFVLFYFLFWKICNLGLLIV